MPKPEQGEATTVARSESEPLTRSRRPWLHGRRSSRRAASAVAILAIVFSLAVLAGPQTASGAPRPKPTPTPTPAPACGLVPQLRDVTVNQGLGSYQPLARGKETLVRAFLSLPQCAATGSSIAVTGGSLSIASAGTVLAPGIAPTPLPVSPFPQVATFATAALTDSPGDPMFVVPGATWNHPGNTERYAANLTVRIDYQSKASSTATPVNGSITFTALSGSSTPITASVERRTSALRILVVPMGNASESYGAWFSAGAQAAIQNGMQTLSRLFPVPDGIGSLGSTTGGVRYTINPTLLDIAPLLSNGAWCGTGQNFDAIKAQLAQFRLSWNTANPEATADIVVGAIDGAKSGGLTDGCAEGMASVVSPEAWVRAIPDARRVPSTTGALLGMEVGHALGLVPDKRDDFYSPFHSPNLAADASSPNRGYNVPLRSFLADDRTVMTLTTGWDNTNTLLERDDYAFLLCRLGGGTTADCPTTGNVGSVVGVGADPSFVISGVTDGTGEDGTNILESYFAMAVARTTLNAGSPYRLVQLNGGDVLRNDGIPVSFTESHHDHEEGDDGVGHTASALIAASVPFNTAATRIELRKDSTLLYARNRNEPPVVLNTSVLPGGLVSNFTESDGPDDTQPALTTDGEWLAWTEYDGEQSVVQVAPVADRDLATPLLDGESMILSSDPAWCGDGSKLAYVADGDLYVLDVVLDPAGATFGPAPEQALYEADVEFGQVIDPTWSPGCSQIAFEDEDDIWRIDVEIGMESLEQLTDDGISHSPSWSKAEGDDRIVFEREASGGIVLLSFVEPLDDGPIGPADHAGTQFTVNSNDDDVDDTACDESHCSLREAILAANALAGGDSIHFAIGDGPVTIQPTLALPTITDPVVIDGTTQPGFDTAPIVEIDGQLTPDDNTVAAGLHVTAGGSEIRGLVINRFDNRAVLLETDGGNVVAGNYLGLNTAGDAGFAGSMAFGGIEVRSGSADNVIGGPAESDRNVVWRGIWIRGATSFANDIVNNYVGLDSTGTDGLGGFGIHVFDPPNTQILDNLVASVSIGIDVSGSAPDGTVIQGNRLGIDASGAAAIPSSAGGIQVQTGTDTIIGGPAPGEANVISGHAGRGVTIGSAAVDTVVEGNLIGVDATGQVALGNGANGIQDGGSGTTIRGNVVSGNGGGSNHAGVSLLGSGGIIHGNLIGTDIDGIDAIPNVANGIEMQSATDAADGYAIGGLAAGQPNTIANNGRDGIRLAAVSGQQNRISGNVIRDNVRLGINLGDDLVTPNDADDTDGGANLGQNYPELTGATVIGDTVEISGTLDSAAETTYSIQYFTSPTCDGSGNGEGESFIGVANIGTDGSGDATFTSSFPEAGVVEGSAITATATDPDGNTSEFSACVEPVDVGLTLVVNSVDDPGDGTCDEIHCTLREALGTDGVARVEFAIGTGGAQTITLSEPLLPVGEVEIDGSTQPAYEGSPLVELDGGELADDPEGFDYGLFLAGGATVRALAITGFPEGGITIQVDNDNEVVGSYIGLRPDGTPDGNHGPGIEILDSSENLIGGSTAATRNVISANEDGIQLHPQSASNQIHGNYIGLDPLGEEAIGNGTYGIYVADSSANQIGGSNPGDGNVIADHLVGIKILDLDDFDAGGNVIQGNSIGTDADALEALPNEAGISISASDNRVGGTLVGAGNIVAGNNQVGIEIVQTEVEEIGNNVVEGNSIGVGADGLALGNGGDGIRIDSSHNSIGGTDTGSGNVIANNTGNGVTVVDDTEFDSHANSILGNSIFDNGETSLGIDLGDDGVTENDPGDTDTNAPNRLQNMPNIESATSNGDETTIEVELNSSPIAPFDIELFVNDACGGLEYGEGRTLIDRFEVTTNSDGIATATRVLEADYAGEFITATATNASADTSEFSQCNAVTGDGSSPSGLYILSAGDGIGSQELLVANGSAPSFGPSDVIAFERDGEIWSVGSDGLDPTLVPNTGPDDASPALAVDALALQRLLPSGEESTQFDVMLLNASATVSASAEATIPEDARFDIFFDCGGPFFPVAVGLLPDAISADGTVQLVYSFDQSLSCGDGTPALTAVVSDGFLRSGFTAEAETPIVSQPKAPVAAIYSPLDGGEILQFGVIPLKGSAKDAEDGELGGVALEWTITGPDGTNVPTAPGTGTTLDLAPPADGWTVGTYTATLTGTDDDGAVTTATVEFDILADADHDGIPAAVETAPGSCLGPDADNNPFNAFGDQDLDGIPTIDDLLTDGGPCVAETEYDAIAAFDPETLFVLSSGKTVTMSITIPYRSLADVAPSSVRITAIGGRAVDFANVGWSIKNGVGVAKFDRQALVEYLIDEGIVNDVVAIAVTGHSRAGISPEWTFGASDTTFVLPK